MFAVRRRHVPSLCTLFALGALLLPLRAPAAPLPADLVRLLPADPIAVVVAPSLDEFTRDLRSLIALFDAETAAGFDPLTMFGGSVAELGAVVDLTRPVALAVRLEPGAPMPLISAVLPLRDPQSTLADFRARVGMDALALESGYVVVGSDPGYQPGNAKPLLVQQLPEADLAARLDLRAVFDHFGPMLDMIIGMALSPPQVATPDSASDSDVDAPAAGLGPEQVDQVLSMVGMIRDGIRTLELAVDVDGVHVELRGGLDVDPDGPLALGAQPAREVAMELLRRLPVDAGTAGYVAGALDVNAMTSLFEGFADFATEAARTTVEGGGVGDQFYAQLSDVVRDLYDLNREPHAWSFGSSQERMFVHGIVETPRPRLRIDELFTAMSSLNSTGFEVERIATRTVDDLEVQRFRFDYDLFALTQDAVDAPDPQELEQIDAWMKGLMPELEVATTADRVLVSTAYENSSGIGALIASERTGGDMPDVMREVIEWAGPSARAWWWMDLTRVIAMVAIPLESLPQGENDRIEMPSPEELDQMPTMPVKGAVTLEQGWLRGRMSLDLLAVATFAKLLESQ